MKKRIAIFVIILFGFILRLIAGSLGYTYDMESYALVGNIVTTGGIVYSKKSRYNYCPIWMYILGGLYKFSLLTPFSQIVFRFGITALLSIADIGIFLLLLRQYSITAALLYYLNPLVILLTGFGSQFENIAILLGMLAVIKYPKQRVLSLILLGISLSVKHIYFVFPVWLALRETNIRERIKSLFIPYIIFALGFVPYIASSFDGILKNVLLYKSFFNAPLWNLIIPDMFKRQISPYMLFFGALLLFGYLFRKRKLFDSLLLYGAVLVIFSIAVSDQYFTILMPFVAVFPNIFFLGGVFVHFIHSLIVINGGEKYSALLQLTMDRHTFGYHWQIGLFFTGFLSLMLKNTIQRLSIRKWIYILTAILLSMILFIYIPSKREDKIVREIEQTIIAGDYEKANALYNQTQIDPPFAGSRYWYKLRKSRVYIEYYRNYRKASDIFKLRKDPSDQAEIHSYLKNMPPDFKFSSEVMDMQKYHYDN